MTNASSSDLRALLDRVARLAAADAWSDQLNPTQLATLEYLQRANRFSRAPSHVADYLGATRGTVSQTLKSLERKGFVSETRSATDKRRTSYGVTKAGAEVISSEQEIARVLAALPKEQRAGLEQGLRAVLNGMLKRRGGRSFGLCKTCTHHQNGPDGGFCQLLQARLLPEEGDQICHEHAA